MFRAAALAFLSALVLAGTAHASPLLDRARSVAVGPTGDAYVGDSAGTIARVTPSGQVVSLWRLPVADRAPVTGLSVTSNGVVYGTLDQRPFSITPNGTLTFGEPIAHCNATVHDYAEAMGIATSATRVYVGRGCRGPMDVYDRQLRHIADPPDIRGMWPVVAGGRLFVSSYDYLNDRVDVSSVPLGGGDYTPVLQLAGGFHPLASDGTHLFREESPHAYPADWPIRISTLEGDPVGDLAEIFGPPDGDHPYANYAAGAGRFWFTIGDGSVRWVPSTPGAPTPTVITPDTETSGYSSAVRKANTRVVRRSAR